MYINDIVEEIGSHIRLFADDTSLFIIVDDPVTSAARLNTDLEKISRWAITWLVTFNPTKSESFLVSRKVNRLIHPNVYMQNVQIEEVECHKHLGVCLSNDCSWHQHITYIKEKAWCRINIMRKLKFQLDRKSLETVYIAFIRPLLEYADVIWDNCSQYEKDDLEKIQIEAARIATGTTKLISLNNLYKEICWDKLQKRRDDHKLTLFYKMYNNLTPYYLSSLIPQQVEAISQYNLRNAQDIRNIRSRTSLYYNSFLPSTLRQWNNLSTETRQSNSLNSFKCILKKDKPSVPRYYYFGSRKAQSLHTCLRTGCSSLNLDLFLKNISESPMCSCGSIEDTQHFFFHCNLYLRQRRLLLNSVSNYCTPTLHILLHGDSSMPDNINENIFKHVHEFIIDSKRF